jgi:hypothetical protein
MDRKEQLKEFAKKIGDLEKEYNVGICSSDGHTNAVIVDQITGNGYEYQFRQGLISLCTDE